MLDRWDVVKVFRPDLPKPHHKYCICLNWEERWFLYINSEPPQFRKARNFAVSVERHEVHGLIKTSHIDTTAIIDDLPPDELTKALEVPSCRWGPLAPFIVNRITSAITGHNVFTAEQMGKFLP